MVSAARPRRLPGRSAARRAAVAPFIAMDVLAAANERAARGQDVIHLEVGEPGGGPPAAVIEAARDGALIAETSTLAQGDKVRARDLLAAAGADVAVTPASQAGDGRGRVAAGLGRAGSRPDAPRRSAEHQHDDHQDDDHARRPDELVLQQIADPAAGHRFGRRRGRVHRLWRAHRLRLRRRRRL